MKKTKHTPGPWSGGKEAINDVKGRLIANVWFKGVSGDIPAEEGNANSSLIAAAPELLQALKQITEAFSRYNVGSENNLYEITQARAAINKAEDA